MDVFISHASEDKRDVARPLAVALTQRGFKVWFDEYTLKLGDSLRREIDRGLGACRYGVVVLSPHFFAKEWPQRELDALAAREVSEKGKVILPVWHNVDHRFVALKSPTLADKIGVSTAGGLAYVVEQIADVLSGQGASVSLTQKKEVLYSFSQQNILEWIELQNQVFPGVKPQNCRWTSPPEIVEVLARVGARNRAHCFFPSGGGLDLLGAHQSIEAGCIELLFGAHDVGIVRPKELHFYYFREHPGMSYFRLDSLPLPPVDDTDALRYDYEELAELAPLDYQPRSVLDVGYSGHDEEGLEIPLPDATRHVTRWFRGSFVFFAKGSFYNHLKGKYDAYNAQHDKMSADEFHAFVKQLMDTALEHGVQIDPIYPHSK